MSAINSGETGYILNHAIKHETKFLSHRHIEYELYDKDHGHKKYLNLPSNSMYSNHKK